MAYTKIESIEDLKKQSRNKSLEGFIHFHGGLRSSKTIRFDSATEIFDIINQIDDSEQLLIEKELYTKSNIGEVIEQGAFYKY